jgi:outer membrane lipoprotein-sorting protein
VKVLRTLSTPRLVAAVAVLIAVAAGSAALAIAAGASGPTPEPKALATALHDALTGTAPAGVTARITFTNNLFPSGALTGAAGSALLSSADGRLWANADGRGRLELTSNAGDVQIVWDADKAWAYDASSNTVYKFALPAASSPAGGSDTQAAPGLSAITSFLSRISEQADVSAAQPDNVGHQPAYTVQVSPKHDGGLLGSAQLAFDAANGVPLRVAVYAQGSSAPALALEATDVSFGAVDASTLDISPPAGAHVVDLGAASPGGDSYDRAAGTPDASTVAAVQAAVDFPVAAPDTLVGLPRQHVGLAGKDAAVVVYGHGLGAVVALEQPAVAGSTGAGALTRLPAASIGGTPGRVLETTLGSAVRFTRGGVTFTVAGFQPVETVERVAAGLR